MSAAVSHIHKHQPWLKSTGPRSVEGKAVSRMNALKHGQRSAAVINERRAVKHYLRVQREYLKQIRLLLHYQRAGVSKKIIQKLTNELFYHDFPTLVIPSVREESPLHHKDEIPRLYIPRDDKAVITPLSRFAEFLPVMLRPLQSRPCHQPIAACSWPCNTG